MIVGDFPYTKRLACKLFDPCHYSAYRQFLHAYENGKGFIRNHERERVGCATRSRSWFRRATASASGTLLGRLGV
jgi:hypothetical protein